MNSESWKSGELYRWKHNGKLYLFLSIKTRVTHEGLVGSLGEYITRFSISGLAEDGIIYHYWLYGENMQNWEKVEL